MFSRHPMVTSALAGLGLVLTAGAAQAALVIRNTPTSNVSCSAGMCTATAGTAVMNVSDLTSMLASSDVTLVAGSMAKNVKVLSAFSWTSAHRLTLDAYRSIVVANVVTVAGPGALTLTTNDGGSGGTFSTQFPARVDFWDLSSSLTINGNNYTLIGDIAGLAAVTKSGAHIALAKNYDASADGTYTSSPKVGWDGVFEGLGHVISHFSIHASTGKMNIGLFSWIGNGGQVENVGLTGVFIRGGFRSSVGALAGWNDGSITNTFAKGHIQAGKESYVGGLVGLNRINVNQGSYDDIGTIESSYTAGKVTGGVSALVGGLVGFNNYGSKIRNSHSTAEVVGTTNSAAGGLVGWLQGSLTDSWASGSVTVGDNNGGLFTPGSAGGLVGSYFNDPHGGADLVDCYATGNVTGGQSVGVGGLVGYMYVSSGSTPIPTTSSYATGRPAGGTGSDIGGFIGEIINSGSFSDTYWDMDTSSISDPSNGAGNIANEPGITGLTTAQFQSGLPAGFDPSIWTESPSINGGYPYLIANPPP